MFFVFCSHSHIRTWNSQHTHSAHRHRRKRKMRRAYQCLITSSHLCPRSDAFVCSDSNRRGWKCITHIKEEELQLLLCLFGGSFSWRAEKRKDGGSGRAENRLQRTRRTHYFCKNCASLASMLSSIAPAAAPAVAATGAGAGAGAATLVGTAGVFAALSGDW